MHQHIADAISRKLAEGCEPLQIVNSLRVPVEFVHAVAEARPLHWPSAEEPSYRDFLRDTATRLVRAGFDERVVWCNFSDACTLRELRQAARQERKRQRLISKQRGY